MSTAPVISISLVIALETFVGEKERRSLEPLFSTPLTNTELYVGKTLAAMIPPFLDDQTRPPPGDLFDDAPGSE